MPELLTACVLDMLYVAFCECENENKRHSNKQVNQVDGSYINVLHDKGYKRRNNQPPNKLNLEMTRFSCKTNLYDFILQLLSDHIRCNDDGDEDDTDIVATTIITDRDNYCN